MFLLHSAQKNQLDAMSVDENDEDFEVLEVEFKDELEETEVPNERDDSAREW
jgi:hypothetical protein